MLTILHFISIDDLNVDEMFMIWLAFGAYLELNVGKFRQHFLILDRHLFGERFYLRKMVLST